VNLKTSSSEKVDLMVTMPSGSASFQNMAAQGQLMDITDLLPEYGQGVLDTVGNLIEGTTLGGRVYGVTTYRSLVTSVYIVMRTDVLEDLGLLEQAQNMQSLDDYEAILEAVHNSDNWSNLSCIVPSDAAGTCMGLGGFYLATDTFADAQTYDQLGDLNKIIAINPDGSDPTVVNNFATDEYRAIYDKMHDWYEKGYVYRDSTTNQEQAEQLVKSNVAFSYFSQSEIGIESSKEQACGMPMTCVLVKEPMMSTSNCTKFVWAVPSSATEPEAAIEFMNMMYTDERICNLLAWGVEDVNYTVDEEGIAHFVEGEDANNAAYHTVDFLYGNQFLVHPWEGQDVNLREEAQEQMDNIGYSAYFGFAADTTEVSTQLSAIANVLGQYQAGIDSGISDPEVYDQFLAALDSAGIQDVVDLYQTQLDEWLAAGNSSTGSTTTSDTEAAAETEAVAETEASAE
ncbi:ABC transporter substrate-binding protein, partial [Catenibacillus scindens]|uniref:ABC transporter substrate-binding protein n=1 Tax=Catenibacillus scindens TaxID=673271 RepID=UPI00320A01B0